MAPTSNFEAHTHKNFNLQEANNIKANIITVEVVDYVKNAALGLLLL